MNKNISIIIVGAVVLLLAAVAYWSFNRDVDDDHLLRAIPEGWLLYQNTEFGFRVGYPSESMIQQEADTHIKFTYLDGPQATGEVTDGFTFTIGTEMLEIGQTLRQFSQANYEEQLRAGTSLQSPIQTSLYGTSAYSYRVENLGESTVYIVRGSDDTRVHTISYIIADPNNQNYEEMVQNMLRTFQVMPVQDNVTDPQPNSNTANDTSSQQPSTIRTVRLAMLDVSDEGEGERFGCDYLAFVERTIPPTAMPLTAAMQELFSISTTNVGSYYNFIANTNDTLSFDRVTVTNGTASIYLTGRLSGLSGVCDDPRAHTQIVQTALQFETVNNVQIYLNGEATDLLPPGQR